MKQRHQKIAPTTPTTNNPTRAHAHRDRLKKEKKKMKPYSSEREYVQKKTIQKKKNNKKEVYSDQ